jgi:hypothetical protein
MTAPTNHFPEYEKIEKKTQKQQKKKEKNIPTIQPYNFFKKDMHTCVN